VSKRVAARIKTASFIRSLSDKDVPVKGRGVVIESGCIAEGTADAPVDAVTIDIRTRIVFRRFLKVHDHTVHGPLCRGIVQNLPRRAVGASET
jgi:hypothetical protein